MLRPLIYQCTEDSVLHCRKRRTVQVRMWALSFARSDGLYSALPSTLPPSSTAVVKLCADAVALSLLLQRKQASASSQTACDGEAPCVHGCRCDASVTQQLDAKELCGRITQHAAHWHSMHRLTAVWENLVEEPKLPPSRALRS